MIHSELWISPLVEMMMLPFQERSKREGSSELPPADS